MTARRGRGRPPRFDDTARARYLDLVTRGAKLGDAATAVGITVQWAKRVANTDPAFAAALTVAKTAGRAVRQAHVPHSEYRYIHLGCRCCVCRKAATEARTGRRQQTTNNATPDTGPDTPARPDIIPLPQPPHPPRSAFPLARAS